MTIKSNYIKITPINDHFNVISDHFKQKINTLDQPNRNGLSVRPSHLRISKTLNPIKHFPLR